MCEGGVRTDARHMRRDTGNSIRFDDKRGE